MKKRSFKIALGEAWTSQSNIPEAITSIIFQYMDGDFATHYSPPYDYDSFTLLGHSFQAIQSIVVRHIAEDAASHILMANFENVIHLVRECPAILYCRIPNVLEPISKKLVIETMASAMPIVRYKNKTLLQIALAEGDFELAAQFKSYLPHNLFVQQLDEQLPANWQQITNLRVQSYQDPISQFLRDLLKIEFPEDFKVISTYLSALCEFDPPTPDAPKCLDKLDALFPLLTTLLEMEIPGDLKFYFEGYFALLHLCFSEDIVLSKFLTANKDKRVSIENEEEMIKDIISLYKEGICYNSEAKPELLDRNTILEARCYYWDLFISDLYPTMHQCMSTYLNWKPIPEFLTIANTFYKAIVNADNQLIDKGLRLSPKLLHDSWDLILNNTALNQDFLGILKGSFCASVVCGTLNVLTPACDVNLFRSSLHQRYKMGCSVLILSSLDIPMAKDEYYATDIGVKTFFYTFRGCKRSTVFNLSSETHSLNSLCQEKDNTLDSLLSHRMLLQEEKQEQVIIPKKAVFQQGFAFFNTVSSLTKEQARPLVDAFAAALKIFLNYTKCSIEIRMRVIQLLYVTEVMGDFFKVKKGIDATGLALNFKKTELERLINEHKRAFSWLINQMKIGLLKETNERRLNMYPNKQDEPQLIMYQMKELNHLLEVNKEFPLRMNDPVVCRFY